MHGKHQEHRKTCILEAFGGEERAAAKKRDTAALHGKFQADVKTHCATPTPATGGVIKEGATGKTVVTIQKLLNVWISIFLLSKPKLVVDGDFGPKTRAKVKEFRRLMHLPASGIVDLPTFDLLDNMLAFISK